MLALNNIEIKEDFASEEEFNAYQQQIDQITEDYFPDKLEFSTFSNVSNSELKNLAFSFLIYYSPTSLTIL